MNNEIIDPEPRQYAARNGTKEVSSDA